MSLFPSKGVDYYTFLYSNTNPLPYSVTFQSPANWGKSVNAVQFPPTSAPPPTLQMLNGNFQISESDIAPLESTGEFIWAVNNGVQLLSNFANIAPFTGNLGDSSMSNMLETESEFINGCAISFGFYDAGRGTGGLTNQDQAYVYVTDDYSNWMGSLAQDPSFPTTNSLNNWALPGAHDAGMFDPGYLSNIITLPSFLGLLGGAVGFAISSLTADQVMRIAVNFAFTQKDTITTMLNLGIRYFDFRPGYFAPVSAGNLYHIHNFVPGYAYSSFLEDVLTWLSENPTEIVVVNLNFQGFASVIQAPDITTLNTYYANAQEACNTTQTIIAGNQNDLSSSYQTLIQSKTRLIFLNQLGQPTDANKYDSYQSNIYQTTNVKNIIGALNSMNSAVQTNPYITPYNYTVLQLQGTATGTIEGAWTSVMTLSDASSPLLSTKANFDNSTYPWLLQNVTKNLSNNQLVVFLNDFADNALVSYALNITKARLGM